MHIATASCREKLAWGKRNFVVVHPAGAAAVRATTVPFAGFDFAYDALSGTGAARGLLPGWIGDVLAAVRRRDQRPVVPWNADEVAELVNFNRQFGHEAGAHAARYLADPLALAVVTGQQPNLLGSPLYVLYKAATAVVLARSWQELLSRPVIPIFWVASDDHDFTELRECHLMDAEGTVVTLGDQVSRGDGVPADSPAFEWNLADSSARLIRKLEKTLPDGPARGVTLAAVAEALATPATFESVFCRLISSFFTGVGLVMLAPRLQAMRRRAAGVLMRDMTSPGLLAGALAKRGVVLSAGGYPVPLRRDPVQVNCFYMDGRIRHRLMRRDDGVIVAQRPSAPAEVVARQPDEWLEELRSRPEIFSPNVVTRPLAQDKALPSIAYVAGPGEMAYLAQLADAYECYEIPQPLVLPRLSGMLLHASTACGLRAAGLCVEDLLLPVEDLSASVASADPVMSPLIAEVVRLEETIAAVTDRMLATSAAAWPAVRVAIAKTATAQRRSLSSLRRRLWRQGRDLGGSAWSTLACALACVRPLGKVQERILSPLSFGSVTTPQRMGETTLSMANDWLVMLNESEQNGVAMLVRALGPA